MRAETGIKVSTFVWPKSAVAVYKEDVVVGHAPFNLASSISKFLKRDINKAFAKIDQQTSRIWTGDPVRILSLRTQALHREDEGAGRFIGCKRTALKAILECQHN